MDIKNNTLTRHTFRELLLQEFGIAIGEKESDKIEAYNSIWSIEMQAQENSRKGCFFVPFLKGDFYGRSNENRRKRNAQSSHARIRSYH